PGHARLHRAGARAAGGAGRLVRPARAGGVVAWAPRVVARARHLVGGELLDGALVGLQLHRALQRVELDDAPAGAAAVVAGLGALARHALEQLAVHVVLVLQAAHQPPARPRDLLGVERQLLVARHADADGVEALQPGRAAGAVAAHPQRAEDARLVARAHVGELDAGARVLHQLGGQDAQRHLLLARVGDDQQALVDGELEGDDLDVGLHLPRAGAQQPLEVLGLALQLLVRL